MKKLSRVSLAVICTLLPIAVVSVQAEPPDFEYSFDAPEVVSTAPGETVTFEATVLLTTSNNPTAGTGQERGAQGWQLSIGVEGEGVTVLSAGVDGTTAFDLLNNLPPCADGFTAIRIANAEVVDPELIANPGGSIPSGDSEIPVGEPQGPGAVSAVLLPLGDYFPEGFVSETANCPPPGSPGGSFATELEPEGTVDILRLTIECTVPSRDGECQNVRLFFIDGKKGRGQAIRNVVTWDGKSYQPTRAEAVVQCCSTNAPAFEYSFLAPEVSTTAPGETLRIGATVVLTTSDNPTVGTATERGAQGWQMSIGAEGQGVTFLSASVHGTTPFRLVNDLPQCADDSTVVRVASAEVVDPELIANPDGTALRGNSEIPVGEPQGPGAVSLVLLPIGDFLPEGSVSETADCRAPGSPGGSFYTELEPEGTVNLMRLTLECTVPSEEDECANVRLFFVDGKKGDGQAIKNVVTFRGESIVPATPETIIQCCAGGPVGPFVRGDCNGNGVSEGDATTDAIAVLQFNFTGEFDPPCLAACDANNDGTVAGTVVDAVYLLTAGFIGGPPPPPPFPTPGTSSDTRDIVLGCETTAS